MSLVAVSTQVSGLSAQVLSQGGIPNSDTIRILLYGTYTAADFYLSVVDGVMWKPGKVRVLNLTDGTGSEWYLDDTANMVNSGYTQLAAGDKTLVAKANAGVTWSGGKLNFDVSACAPITNDDEVLVELTRG
jgi:hypothetical protein